MKVAIMQPYLFPYLGYFQLICAADSFVIYDDVNYIKGGWINRNYLLDHGNKLLFTLSTEGASPNRLINQVRVGGGQRKLLESIRHSYCRAPWFSTVFPMLEGIFQYPEKNLAVFLDHQLRMICDYLGVHPNWFVSSSLKKNNKLRGAEKIFAICEDLGATHYINAPGGTSLYEKSVFASRKIQLSFIQPRAVMYRQFSTDFIPNLSIIDVLMFNSKLECSKLLLECDLV